MDAIRQEVLEEFLRLFPLLFSANQNARFCQAVTSSFERRQWKRLSAGLRNAAKMGREKVRGNYFSRLKSEAQTPFNCHRGMIVFQSSFSLLSCLLFALVLGVSVPVYSLLPSFETDRRQ